MKVSRERYQTGDISKVKRSYGFAWVFRFYATDESGKRKRVVQTFDSVKYPTERDVRLAVQGQLAAINAGTMAGKVSATFGTILDRYESEELPKLRHSTQTTNKSLIKVHIRPEWEGHRISDVEALEVKQWLDSLPVGPASKVRARNMLSHLFDLAMLWKYLPFGRNPMELVTVKGSTKRQKSIVIITPAQFKTLVEALPEPYNLMVLVTGCLGLRVSETLALKWEDFNWKEGIVTIQRVFTHGQIQNLPKSDSSGADLPVFPKLAQVLQEWHDGQKEESEYVFPSPRTGHPYSDASILANFIKPAAKKAGIEGLGWHTLRHSYKTWMASAKINPAQMKDLMRHSDISTTMDVYGKTLTPELRAANILVASQLF